MKTRHIVVLTAVLALALPMAAQMGMGPRMPDMSGIWHPVVGSGGAYEMTDSQGKKSPLEITVVGQEDVAGKPGFWMEFVMANPRGDGSMIMKSLVAPVADGISSVRSVMQMPGQDPMEIDSNMMGRGARGPTITPSDVRAKADLIGTESITVPAGTFSCQHYRAKDGTSEVWVSEKVSPFGLVKEQSKERSTVLVRVISDAKDQITGTPKKFDPMEMMRQRQQGQ